MTCEVIEDSLTLQRWHLNPASGPVLQRMRGRLREGLGTPGHPRYGRCRARPPPRVGHGREGGCVMKTTVGTVPTEELVQLVREQILEMGTSPHGTHVGGSLSAADVMTLLYNEVLRLRPDEPGWPDRDRFVLSKGHACRGPVRGTRRAGLPARRRARPVRRVRRPARRSPPAPAAGGGAPSGSLGHGLSLGVGSAVAARRQGRPSRVFVLMGDGEIQEGSVWEAAMSAAHLRLDNLVGIVDRNRLQITGHTEERMGLEPLADKWRSFGWETVEVDGHDLDAPARRVHRAARGDRPAHDGDRRDGQGQGRPAVREQEEVAFGEARPGSAPACTVRPAGPFEEDAVTVVEETAVAVVARVAGAVRGREPRRLPRDSARPRQVRPADLRGGHRHGRSRDSFEAELPGQYVNVGIAEANLMGVSAGLAADGLVPFANTIASFAATRACEQVQGGHRGQQPAGADRGAPTAGSPPGTTDRPITHWRTWRSCAPCRTCTVVVPADAAETEYAVRAIADTDAFPGPVYPAPGPRGHPAGRTTGRTTSDSAGRTGCAPVTT